MYLVADITEHEMVATFLRTEIRSERFRHKIVRLVQRDAVSPAVIEQPDVSNPEENAYRIRLLGEFRGYGQNRDMFEQFPAHVMWQRVALTPAELLQAKYIDYDYWNELSNGTRSPLEAAKTIRAGRTVFGVSNDPALRTADALRHGAVFPELILVRAAAERPMVVLEGHFRLTVYALVPELIPADVTVILGTSPDIIHWVDYGLL
jgi:hypothetical protein